MNTLHTSIFLLYSQFGDSEVDFKEKCLVIQMDYNGIKTDYQGDEYFCSEVI